MSKSKTDIEYVRKEDAPVLPPPINQVGLIGWLWRNGISSMTNFSSVTGALQSIFMILLTIVILYLGLNGIWTLVDFAFIQAIWSDSDELKRLACATTLQGGSLPEEWFGACWPFIAAKSKLLIYGVYDIDEIWRVNLTYLILFVGIGWVVIEKMPYRFHVGIFLLVIYPIIAFVLLTGGNLEIENSTLLGMIFLCLMLSMFCFLMGRGFLGEGFRDAYTVFNIVRYVTIYVTIVTIIFTTDFGLVTVETDKWGGLLVTLVVAITGIVASLPLGILLALGRRSSMPVIRLLCVLFIEFWRGVPLITVLFMASFMLPLFLPEGTDFNKLLRALIGVTLFSAAYMAEVIRGGLQAIPKGQFEAASGLGLSYYQTSRLIILPQALVLVIPGIVNTFIGLFKDTTLVLIISLFDLLGMIQSSFADPNWSTPVQALTGYLAVASIFWVILFSMSRYSMFMEKKLRYEH